MTRERQKQRYPYLPLSRPPKGAAGPRLPAGGQAPPAEKKAQRFGIVVSRFNEFITKRLLHSAIDTLTKAGVRAGAIETVWVPGALEVPFFAKKLALTKKFDALIVLGCVLRGETIHFENVSNEITRGVSQVALETGVPVASGVIMADSLEQAIDRAGLRHGNKGTQAALAAIEIANLNSVILSPRRGRRISKRDPSGLREAAL